jgi:hypothetical protein
MGDPKHAQHTSQSRSTEAEERSTSKTDNQQSSPKQSANEEGHIFRNTPKRGKGRNSAGAYQAEQPERARRVLAQERHLPTARTKSPFDFRLKKDEAK